MIRDQLNTFKEILEARRAELMPSMEKRDDIAIQRVPDLLEEVQLASERELATRNLERRAKLWRDVRAALVRIDEGTYGTCLDCEEEIGLKRLNALPWTPLCIRCQEQSDSRRRAGVEFCEHLLLDGA